MQGIILEKLPCSYAFVKDLAGIRVQSPFPIPSAHWSTGVFGFNFYFIYFKNINEAY